MTQGQCSIWFEEMDEDSDDGDVNQNVQNHMN